MNREQIKKIKILSLVFIGKKFSFKNDQARKVELGSCIEARLKNMNSLIIWRLAHKMVSGSFIGV